jgi:hypothetical protein
MPSVILDWYPKVQVIRSAKNNSQSAVNTLEEGKMDANQLAFVDWTKVFFEIQKFKNERSWYNVNLSVDALKDILHNPHWYTLYIPSSELEVSDFGKVKLWNELATSLLKAFVERIYNYQKNRFYSDKLEVAILDNTHPNFEEEYKFLVKKTEDRLITKLKELKELVGKKKFQNSFQVDKDFEAIFSQMHLYQPLIYIDNGRYEEVVKLQPVALNKGERDFVNDLKSHFEKEAGYFKDKQLYLLRNMSKKGIGFFEANNFFPDFILWLVINERQYVSFIDPKGLRQIQGLSDPKIELHKTIKSTIQPKLNDPNIELSSFIVSNTPYNQLAYWKGQDSIDDMNANNVYFQNEQKSKYVQLLLSKMQDNIT